CRPRATRCVWPQASTAHPCSRAASRLIARELEMNQVTEMFRLNDTARTDEALARLSGLFDVMAQQPGFLHAEVTREVADAKTLLVFHAWSRLEDWQAFQKSQWKLDFMAARPEGLYSPVPVGMN